MATALNTNDDVSGCVTTDDVYRQAVGSNGTIITTNGYADGLTFAQRVMNYTCSGQMCIKCLPTSPYLRRMLSENSDGVLALAKYPVKHLRLLKTTRVPVSSVNA